MNSSKDDNPRVALLHIANELIFTLSDEALTDILTKVNAETASCELPKICVCSV